MKNIETKAPAGRPPSGAVPDLNGVRIDAERLWALLMELAEIVATPRGGVCRLALTDLDRQGRDLVRSWLRAAGCTVTVDRIGNIFGRRPGRNESLPPVVAGSHIRRQLRRAWRTGSRTHFERPRD